MFSLPRWRFLVQSPTQRERANSGFRERTAFHHPRVLPSLIQNVRFSDKKTVVRCTLGNQNTTMHAIRSCLPPLAGARGAMLLPEASRARAPLPARVFFSPFSPSAPSSGSRRSVSSGGSRGASINAHAEKKPTASAFARRRLRRELRGSTRRSFRGGARARGLTR